MCLHIYFPFPLIPAVLDGHYTSSYFLFPLLLGSQCVYLFIFSFLYFLLFRIDIICSVIFYFLSYSDHSLSTYLFSLSFTSFCSGWIPYILLFSISSAAWITVSPLIYFSFPLLPAVLDVHDMSSRFLFPLLLGSQCVYLFIVPFLDFILFWMDTIYPAFSISSATRITVSLLIYFAFPLLPAVLDGHYISRHFLFPLLLRSQ